LGGGIFVAIVGPYTTVQLYRLKSKGRFAAVIFFGFICLTDMLDLFYSNQTKLDLLFPIFDLIIFLILFSKPSREICKSQ